MEKIKIVHVYKSFDVYNGLIEILSILANTIDHDRFQLIACVNEYNENDFGERFKKNGGIIENLSVKNRWYNEPEALKRMYQYFKQSKPDIVQTHVLKANLTASLIAKAAKVPVVIATEMTLKDIAPTPLRRVRDKILQQFTMYSLGRCDKFVVTSDYIKSEWNKNAISKKIQIIYPPFNLDKFNKAMSGITKKESVPATMVGFVGRLSEEKSVITLVDAMRIVHNTNKDVRCTIVGTGPIEASLKNRVSSFSLQNTVNFTGYSSNSFEALGDMDIFVLPSRTEGCPIVILEAMAMGLPVIATNVGGNPELVLPGSTGILIPVSSPEILADSILKLVNDKKLAKDLGARGKEIAFTKFHPSVFTDKLQQLYIDLLKKNSKNH